MKGQFPCFCDILFVKLNSDFKHLVLASYTLKKNNEKVTMIS